MELFENALDALQVIFVAFAALFELALVTIIIAMPLLMIWAIHKAAKSLIAQSKRNDGNDT